MQDEEERRNELVKSALIWTVSELRTLHAATGLFEVEMANQRNFSRALFDRQNAEMRKTAFGLDLYRGRREDELPDDHPSKDPEILKEIQEERKRLEALPLDELEEHVEALRQRNLDEKEQARIFNWPENRLHNLGHWVRLSTWTPSQAILILGDREPSQDVIDGVEKMYDHEIESSPFAQAFFTVRKLMQSAIDIDEISQLGRPLEYLRWFDKMKYEVPRELRHGILEIHAPDEWQKLQDSDVSVERPLRKDERESVLKIIAGMAIGGYKFDDNASRNEATGDIKGDMERLGLEMDKNTLLKWLREACALAKKQDKSR